MSSVRLKPKQLIFTTRAEGSAPRGERAQFEKSPLRESCGNGGKGSSASVECGKTQSSQSRGARATRKRAHERAREKVLRLFSYAACERLLSSEESIFNHRHENNCDRLEQSKVSNRPARRRCLWWALSVGSRCCAGVCVQDAEVKLRFLSYGRAVSPASLVLCTARPCERFAYHMVVNPLDWRNAKRAHTCTHTGGASPRFCSTVYRFESNRRRGTIRES